MTGVRAAYDRLKGSIAGGVRRDESLARHTTYRIGGPAALFVECATVSDLATALGVLDEEGVEYAVLGKGSNMLVADSGYDGAVLVLGRDFKRHSVDGERLKTGAGVILAAIVQDAFSQGLTGLEFAVGVPGTVGGALVMNAGTSDEWIGSVVESVTLFAPGVGLVSRRGPEIAWAYRRTDLAEQGIVLEAALKVAPGDRDAIRQRMEAGFRRRKRTQPLGIPSAGSVFANPEGDSAGRLIEAARLKGTRIGGAEISEVHANFIVNHGRATAADVVTLMRLARDTVRDTYGVELRPEVQFLGAFREP